MFIPFKYLNVTDIPSFVQKDWFINTMKSHLLAKDKHYKQFNWDVTAKSGYYGIDKNGEFQMYSVKTEKYKK